MNHEAVPMNLHTNRPMTAMLSPQTGFTADYFMAHWQELLPSFISKGRPSSDTKNTYFYLINQFLRLCQERHHDPLTFTELQIRGYLQWLYEQGYKNDTVALKLVAVRAFYHAACKVGILAENPCRDVFAADTQPDELIHYFTPEQMNEICDVFKSDDNEFRILRNVSMLYLMGVEGLRNVEIHRMNREDIDWDMKTILIHGKGHNRRIYPCDETLHYLREYLRVCPKPVKDGAFTPMFLSDSHNNLGKRISRDGLRFIMNKALKASGYKKPGISCHVFRHSTATNLYQATKDIRLVQETLGHRDPKTTARYAHVQERMSRRTTSTIVPRPKNKD